MKMWGLSSAGRAPAWHAGGQRFDPARLHHFHAKPIEIGGYLGQLIAVPSFLPTFNSRLGWPFACAFALVGLFGGLWSALKLGPTKQESAAFDLGQRFAVDQSAADLEVRGSPDKQHPAEVPAHTESHHFILLEGGTRLQFDEIIAKAAIGALRVILVQPDAVSDRPYSSPMSP